MIVSEVLPGSANFIDHSASPATNSTRVSSPSSFDDPLRYGMRVGRAAMSMPRFIATLGLVLGVFICVSAGDASAQLTCRDDVRPTWWGNYRIDGFEEGKLTGGGSERGSTKKSATKAATESAKRELSSWLSNNLLAVANWYATEFERQNSEVTPQRVSDLVNRLAASYEEQSTRAQSKSFRRCDGDYEAYSVVEISSQGMPAEVARQIMNELSGKRPFASDEDYGALRAKIRVELDLRYLTIMFTSNPDSAEVWVDGSKRCDATPCEVVLKIGTNDYQMRKTKYGEQSGSVDVATDVFNENLTLSRNQAFVTIISTPSNASVYLDDKKVGSTPLRHFEVEPRSHRIKIRKSGFDTYEREISVERGEDEQISANLSPEAPSKTYGNSGFYVGIGLGIGKEKFKNIGPVSIDTAYGVDIWTGLRMGQLLAIEAQVQILDGFDIGTQKTDTVAFAGNLKVYVLDGQFQPYGLIGYGTESVKFKLGLGESETVKGGILRYGGGFDIYANDQLSLSVGVTYVKPSGDLKGADYLSIYVGPQYLF